MLLELLIVKHSHKILHFIYPGAVALIYLTFTVIYYFAGGVNVRGNRFIYAPLDYSRPLTASLAFMGIILLTIVMHFIVLLIQHLRRKLYGKCQ